MSRSTTEAEYIALGVNIQEILWFKKLLTEFGFGDQMVRVNVDIQRAIQLCKNPRFHDRSKHAGIQHNFIRENVNSDDVFVKHVPTKQNVSDISTKALPKPTFQNLRSNIGIEHVMIQRECYR